LKKRKVAVLVTLFAVACVGEADARSHPEGRTGVPAMVQRVLPAIVSIATRQLERDQFNQAVPTRGRAFRAVLVGGDHSTDVVVLTIHGQSVPRVPLVAHARGGLGIRVTHGARNSRVG
jgi:hypothetical protein